MKEFWTDYNEMVWKPYLGWMKKHWKGFILLNAVVMIIECVIFSWNSIVDGIDDLKQRFRKEEET